MDEDNCKWCKNHGAILITNDRGKTNRDILDALAQHHVHAVFVYDDLRSAPAHNLARALLVAESKMDQLAKGRGLIHHRLGENGTLRPRTKSKKR